MVTRTSPIPFAINYNSLIDLHKDSCDISPKFQFVSSLAGSANIYSLGNALYGITGVTASSSGYLWALMQGNDLFSSFIDYSKPLEWLLFLSRYGLDAEFKGNIHLTRTPAAAANLTMSGLGLYIENMDLYLESYGASGRAQELLTSLSEFQSYMVHIIHSPDEQVVRAQVNNGIWNSITNPVYIPLASDYGSEAVISMNVRNGVTGGVDCGFTVANPLIIAKGRFS